MPKFKFGKAFNDELKKTARASGHFHNKKISSHNISENLLFKEFDNESTKPTSPWRRSFIMLALVIGFTLLFGRLFHLQIARGKENLELADSNRILIKTIHAPRGVIYDRNGKILAANSPGFRVASNSLTKDRYISREEAIDLEVRNDPSFNDLEIDSLRNYIYSETASHILGYLTEINALELKEEKYSNYKIGDKIGRGGVEEAYERILKGIDGGEIIEVDAAGRKLRTLRKKDEIPGQSLKLTLDIDLQKVTHDYLNQALIKAKSCCGAAIITDPNTGEILSLVSIPSFDPDDLSVSLKAENSPLLNRAIAGVYPPGSTFKIVSGLAGLESGKITADTKFEDTGVVSIGETTFANWFFTQYGRKEDGPVDLVKALKRSNDIYFYKMGELVGEGVIIDQAKKLGFGKRIGIDISGEEEGLVPDDEWKQKTIGDVWYPGDTLHLSIGQGFLLSTPLQIASLISYVASDGKQFPLHLGLEIEDEKGNTVKRFKYDPINNQVNLGYLNLIKQGLEAVTEDGGTAWPFFNFPIQTAGKTGTAEFGDSKNRTHAWYTAYAPVKNPKITITVLLEGGGEGSSVASPVVKEILRWYFSPDKNNLVRDIGSVATESAKTLGE